MSRGHFQGWWSPKVPSTRLMCARSQLYLSASNRGPPFDIGSLIALKLRAGRTPHFVTSNSKRVPAGTALRECRMFTTRCLLSTLRFPGDNVSGK